MRIVVTENKTLQDAEISKIKNLISMMQKLVDGCKESTAYCITMEDIRLLATNSDPAISVVQLRIDSFMNDELDRLKIAPTLMRTNFKAGLHATVKGLAKDLQSLFYNLGTGYLEGLEIDKGRIVLSAEHEELIRESFRIVIQTENAKDMYDLHHKTAKQLSTFLSFLQHKTSLRYALLRQLVDECFELDQASGTIEPATLDYERITKPLSSN